jgi:hypothetical protein
MLLASHKSKSHAQLQALPASGSAMKMYSTRVLNLLSKRRTREVRYNNSSGNEGNNSSKRTTREVR